MGARITLREARLTLEMTRHDLAIASGVSVAVIRRVENGGDDARIKDETACLIARSLACSVEEIDWPKGLSDRGRPPLTGAARRCGKITQAKYCPFCNLELPATGICDCHQ